MREGQEFEGLKLLNVIALSLRKLGDLELVAVQLYSDGIAVGWQYRDRHAGRMPSVELHDEFGTSYVAVAAYAAGGLGHPLGVMRGETVFVPTIPRGLAAVRIRVSDDEFELPLADDKAVG